jgi:hypothetical protein
MCATCGCSKTDKKAPGYGRGKSSKAVGKKTMLKKGPVAKKMSMNRKKGM